MKTIEADVNREPETFDEQGNLAYPPPPKIDLRDAHAIRREIGRVYREGVGLSSTAPNLPTPAKTVYNYV